jgi:hypothetical protein
MTAEQLQYACCKAIARFLGIAVSMDVAGPPASAGNLSSSLPP